MNSKRLKWQIRIYLKYTIIHNDSRYIWQDIQDKNNLVGTSLRRKLAFRGNKNEW